MPVRYGSVKEITAPFAPKHYLCQRADEPPILDGRLDKPFWENVPWTEEFRDIEGAHRPLPTFKTRAKMRWDDDCLYIGAHLEEDRIFAYVENRDEVIFQDNDFEVFIDPDGDTHNYYEFEMNARNTVWDLLLPKPYRDGGPAINGWDIAGLRTAVHVEGELNKPNAANKFWSLEIAMPWKSLKECAAGGNPPTPGEYWRINFSRVEWQSEIRDGKYQRVINPETGRPFPEDNWIWSPTGIVDMHCPERWGFVVFADGPMTFSIPRDEVIKWELRKIYYRQRNRYASQGSFTTRFEDLQGEDGWTIRPVLEATSALFQASAPTADGKGEWVIFQDGKIIRA